MNNILSYIGRSCYIDQKWPLLHRITRFLQIMGISESFSVRYFSSYDYIDTDSRKAAKKVADIMPGTFPRRDYDAYQKDVEDIQKGRAPKETHNLKADSVVNQIK